MTSRSRRSRPTTPSPNTARRTGISLAVLAFGAFSAVLAEPPPSAPIPPRWPSPPNGVNLPPGTPMPSTTAPTQPTKTLPPPPPSASPIPSNVVIYQKAKTPEADPIIPAIPIAPAPQKKVVPNQPSKAPPPRQPEHGSIEDPTVLLQLQSILPRDRVFQLTSDEDLRNRIARELAEEEASRRKGTAEPDPGPISPENFRPPFSPPIGGAGQYQTKVIRHGYPQMQMVIEPSYVVHRRLLFEEMNAERYGWDTGIIQPFLSAAYFYKDVLLWPSKLASHPFERYDTSAGKCMPGDPVPYYLYPPEVGLFGVSVGAGAIIGTVFLFP